MDSLEFPYSPNIPFNRPFVSGKEIEFIDDACKSGHLSGCGKYTKKCEVWLEDYFGASRALLTHSCTAALEMCALLLNLSEDDEVIMPSYTFVSTANAFKLRNAKIKFVDICPQTLCIDPVRVSEAINSKTRAVIAVNYAGRNPYIYQLAELCHNHSIYLVEDNAQGLGSTYKGRPLGSFGSLSCISFHETKNISSGEGGALIINDPSLVHRAELILEKGTNRSAFNRGEVDKYTWVSLGSSYLPSEINAAFLWAQFHDFGYITRTRTRLWMSYYEFILSHDWSDFVKTPLPPQEGEIINGHIFYLMFAKTTHRDYFNSCMKSQGVHCVFHYVPLHSSPFNLSLGDSCYSLPITDQASSCLTRLPIWIGLDSCWDQIKTAVTISMNAVMSEL